MPRGTNQDGSLAFIAGVDPSKACRIITPCGIICLKILPEISDSKAANYTNEPAPGRTTPILTYASSEPRMINTELHFMITTTDDINYNWWALRIIQSLVYPQPPSLNNTAPYLPPPVVRFVCGDLMDGPNGLCLVLRSYNVRYPTEVAWEPNTFLPYKFSISCSWEVVYACAKLPSNVCANSGGTCQPTTDCETITGVTAPFVAFQPKGQSGSMALSGSSGGSSSLMAATIRGRTVNFVRRGA